MSEKKNIQEEQFEDLLRTFFLDESQHHIHEKMAQKVLNDVYGVEISEKKKQELKKIKKQGFTVDYKNVFYVFIWIVFFGINFWMLIPGSHAISSENQSASKYRNENSIDFIEYNNDVKSHLTETQEEVEPEKIESGQEENTLNSSTSPFVDKNDSMEYFRENVSPDTYKSKLAEKIILSETEIQKYQKIKRWMLDQILKFDKRVYTKVPADKMEYSGEKIILEPFAIRRFGITNLEYRTFLADLILNQKTDEYERARVQATNWDKYNCSELTTQYFIDEKYNDFPVVNVSVEGMELYCQWLEEEIQQDLIHRQLKPRNLKVRLPHNKEWVYLAWSGYAKIYYGEKYNTIFDEEEKKVPDHFIKRIQLIDRQSDKKDSLFYYQSLNRADWSQSRIKEVYKRAFQVFSVYPSDTLYPERMKAYAKFGSVSEISLDEKTNDIWLVGKMWNSKEEYLKLKKEFLKNYSNPFVGFRIVVLDPKDSEYQSPFW